MKVVLCRGRRCCPTIETNEYGYLIKDDYGGEVRLNEAEWQDIRHRILSGEI